MRERIRYARWAGIFVTLLVGLLAFGGCGLSGPDSLQASGHVVPQQRAVSGFDQIDFDGVGQLNVTQGAKEALTVEADQNLLPLLTSDVSDETLTLGEQSGTTIQSADPITFDVTVTQLADVTLSGVGDATISNLTTSSLDITVSGTGHLTITGSADSQQVTISGVGSYDGSGFATKTAMVDVSGTGNAIVRVSDLLNATVSGVGSIEYIGNPQVIQQITGPGSVRQIPAP